MRFPGRTSLLVVAAGLCTWIAVAQTTSPEISRTDILTHIKYLASDELQGRGTGSEGNQKAARYIVGLLEKWGVPPAGDNGTYYQKFEFVSAVKLGDGNALSVSGTSGTQSTAVLEKEFRPFGFSANGSVSGPVVFAGYGISVPGKYDDYAGLDVKGKIVLVLRYSPDGNDAHSEYSQYSSFRNKARIARDNGAAALLIVSGPADDPEDEPVKLGYDQSFSSAGIPALTVKRSFVDPLFLAAGKNLKTMQDSVKANHRPLSFAFDHVTASVTAHVEKVTGTTANVAAALEGTDPAMKDQWLILGAHFDHLGLGGPGSGSLQPDTVAIHPGADDNASGTAGLLELAEAFAAHKGDVKRSLLFLFFSGEEMGTLGSANYVNHPLRPLEKTVAMINMDMIGHLQNKALTVYGVGTSPVWNGLITQENSDSAFTLKPVPDGYGPSDHAQFYGKDLPVLFLFTGTHNDYHKPSDTWDKINYPGEEQVVKYVYKIAGDVDRMAEKPAFTKVAVSTPTGGDTRGFTVTLGVVPDYGGTDGGMKIGGIRPGGPAEKAGLKSGDLVVKMAGKKVLNIYDYMGILGELKIGDVVQVDVIRDGKPVTVTATMDKRK